MLLLKRDTLSGGEATLFFLSMWDSFHVNEIWLRWLIGKKGESKYRQGHQIQQRWNI